MNRIHREIALEMFRMRYGNSWMCYHVTLTF